jgi:Flp pilus assembly protein TadG
MRSARQFLLRLGRDRRGTSLLELGLALPLLMGVLVCLLDVTRLYSAQMSLQQAAARSLERVQVGTNRLTFGHVQQEAATAAGVPTTQVRVDSWVECNNNTTKLPYTTVCTAPAPPPPPAAAPGPMTARYVEVRIESTYTPYYSFTPLGTRRADGKVEIVARSAVRVQ